MEDHIYLMNLFENLSKIEETLFVKTMFLKSYIETDEETTFESIKNIQIDEEKRENIQNEYKNITNQLTQSLLNMYSKGSPKQCEGKYFIYKY